MGAATAAWSLSRPPKDLLGSVEYRSTAPPRLPSPGSDTSPKRGGALPHAVQLAAALPNPALRGQGSRYARPAARVPAPLRAAPPLPDGSPSH